MFKRKTRRPFRFVPSFVPLEARDVPAGNIQAAVVGGVLTIRSDNDFHAIDISGCGERSVIIRPAVGTTINGQSDPLWFGDIKKGFDIQLGDGADSVVFSGVDGRDYISIDTGGGDDAVHIVNGTRSAHSTWIRTGDGNDVIVVTDTIQNDHFAFVGGSGDDRLIVNNVRFGARASFDPGNGNDAVNFSNANIAAPSGFEAYTASAEGPVAGNGSDTNPPADTTAPTVTLSSSAGTVTNLTAIPVTVTFSEAVTGFSSNGVGVSNGTISNFTAVDSKTFTFTVAPTNQGSVIINVVAGAATDTAGNASIASETLTRTFDSVAPTAVVSSTAANPTSTTPIPFSITFSETVANFTASNITVANGSVSNLIASDDNRTFTFNVTPVLDGAVTVKVNAGATQDAAGNGNPESNTVSITFNGAAPTLAFSATTNTNSSPIPVTATFSESVNGFESSDLTLTNATLSNFVQVNDKTWTFDLTPSAEGAVTLQLLADAVTDDDGHANLLGTTFTIQYDTTPPTSTINAKVANNPLPAITGTVSEAGSTVLVTVNGSTIPAVVTDLNWSAQLTTSLGDGTYAVSIQVSDAAGNSSSNSLADGLRIDTIAPTATLTSDVSSPAAADSMIVTAVFSEPVTGLAEDAFTITNGTRTEYETVDGLTVRFKVTPTADGTVTVALAANAVPDAAGNGNGAASLSVTFDRTAPTVALNGNSVDSITGTSADSAAGLQSVEVSIFNGTNYWSGAAFDSATEQFILATSTNNFANWSVPIAATGTYTVHARTTDKAGNAQNVTGSTTVTAATLSDDTGMVDVMPDFDDVNWKVTPSGLAVWDTLVGNGAAVTSTSNLQVFYTGWLTDGTVFDSARTTPASFPLSNLIAGWKEGLPGMQVGGIRRLRIPAALAYGSAGQGSVPPDSILIFEIKLVGVS